MDKALGIFFCLLVSIKPYFSDMIFKDNIQVKF